MAQPRCHMPYVAHRAIVTIHCADTQANDTHPKIFGIVGAHCFPKRFADAIVAVRTNAYRVVYTRERGWIKVGVVTLANTHIRFVEFKHANGMVRAGKDETWHTSLPGGFKHVIRGDNVVRQYRCPGRMHTGICCQVDHSVHAVEGRTDGIEITHIGHRGWDVRSVCSLDAIEARKSILIT